MEARHSSNDFHLTKINPYSKQVWSNSTFTTIEVGRLGDYASLTTNEMNSLHIIPPILYILSIVHQSIAAPYTPGALQFIADVNVLSIWHCYHRPQRVLCQYSATGDFDATKSINICFYAHDLEEKVSNQIHDSYDQGRQSVCEFYVNNYAALPDYAQLALNDSTALDNMLTQEVDLCMAVGNNFLAGSFSFCHSMSLYAFPLNLVAPSRCVPCMVGADPFVSCVKRPNWPLFDYSDDAVCADEEPKGEGFAIRCGNITISKSDCYARGCLACHATTEIDLFDDDHYLSYMICLKDHSDLPAISSLPITMLGANYSYWYDYPNRFWCEFSAFHPALPPLYVTTETCRDHAVPINYESKGCFLRQEDLIAARSFCEFESYAAGPFNNVYFGQNNTCHTCASGDDWGAFACRSDPDACETDTRACWQRELTISDCSDRCVLCFNATNVTCLSKCDTSLSICDALGERCGDLTSEQCSLFGANKCSVVNQECASVRTTSTAAPLLTSQESSASTVAYSSETEPMPPLPTIISATTSSDTIESSVVRTTSSETSHSPLLVPLVSAAVAVILCCLIVVALFVACRTRSGSKRRRGDREGGVSMKSPRGSRPHSRVHSTMGTLSGASHSSSSGGTHGSHHSSSHGKRSRRHSRRLSNSTSLNRANVYGAIGFSLPAVANNYESMTMPIDGVRVISPYDVVGDVQNESAPSSAFSSIATTEFERIKKGSGGNSGIYDSPESVLK